MTCPLYRAMNRLAANPRMCREAREFLVGNISLMIAIGLYPQCMECGSTANVEPDGFCSTRCRDDWFRDRD